MLNFTQFVWSSLIYGIVLSLLLSLAVLGSLRLNPEIWLNDYPEEIRAKYGPMSEKAKKQRIVLASFFLLVVIGVPSLSIWNLYRGSEGQLGFGAIFLTTWIILMVFNLFDLLPHQLAAVYGVPPTVDYPGGQPGMLEMPRLRFLLAESVIT